jgi:DNA-binding MarR family transcriptional regulator
MLRVDHLFAPSVVGEREYNTLCVLLSRKDRSLGQARSSNGTPLIARAVLRLARRLRVELPEPSLGPSALGLLATLHREGPMSAIKLAKAERLQPQSLSRMIASLEQRALIARSRDPHDKRVLVLAITRAGRRSLNRDMGARREWLENTMNAALSGEERDTLLKASAIMLRLAESV